MKLTVEILKAYLAMATNMVQGYHSKSYQIGYRDALAFLMNQEQETNPVHAEPGKQPKVIRLASYPGEHKISVIKVVHEYSGMGLGAAKYLVDHVGQPYAGEFGTNEPVKCLEVLLSFGCVAS